MPLCRATTQRPISMRLPRDAARWLCMSSSMKTPSLCETSPTSSATGPGSNRFALPPMETTWREPSGLSQSVSTASGSQIATAALSTSRASSARSTPCHCPARLPRYCPPARQGVPGLCPSARRGRDRVRPRSASRRRCRGRAGSGRPARSWSRIVALRAGSAVDTRLKFTPVNGVSAKEKPATTLTAQISGVSASIRRAIASSRRIGRSAVPVPGGAQMRPAACWAILGTCRVSRQRRRSSAARTPLSRASICGFSR